MIPSTPPTRPPRCRPRRTVALACIALLAVAPAAGAARSAAPRFADLIHFPYPEGNWDRFHGLEDDLATAFFAACNDDRCRPGHALWPLQMRCSVEIAAGQVAACIWVIAGSDLQVRTAGNIDARVVIWRCPLPLAQPLAVDAFHAALAVNDPLQVRLPGADQTLLQGLQHCLAGSGSSS